MTITATITTKCPDWCTVKEIEDHAEDGHDGLSFPSFPRDGGFNSLSFFSGENREGEIVVNVSSGYGAQLTGEEAVEAGRYLIEAGQWALAHQIA